MSLKNGAVFLFQGDSITDGARGRDEDLNHIHGHGYVYSISTRIGYEYAERNYKFVNKGISAHGVRELYARWEKDTIKFNPDVLSILIGVNDNEMKPEKYEFSYELLLKEAKEANPDLKLILLEPFLLPVGIMGKNWEEAHGSILKKQEVVRGLANKYKAIFVPLQEDFNIACSRASAEYWIWDGVHPTTAGHEVITKKWLECAAQELL